MSLLERDVIALSDGIARCDVAPQAGGSIAGFWWETGARTDWLRPSRPADVARGDAEAMACFPLVPWGNRIRDARFRFCGRDVALPALGPQAIHGHGWRGAWNVVDRAPGQLVMEYRHEPDAWPWCYVARETVTLAEGALSLTLELENLSDSVMPAGLGFHPYFPRRPGALLQADARGMWRNDGDTLPHDLAAIPEPWDFTAARPLADAIDNCFTRWDGRALLQWPRQQARLGLAADWPILSFLMVYTPPARDFFCVEPMSHCPDAVNLARTGAAENGLRVLAPSARRSATMTLTPQLN
jgi:aldose 1-epimerase